MRVAFHGLVALAVAGLLTIGGICWWEASLVDAARRAWIANVTCGGLAVSWGAALTLGCWGPSRHTLVALVGLVLAIGSLPLVSHLRRESNLRQAWEAEVRRYVRDTAALMDWRQQPTDFQRRLDQKSRQLDRLLREHPRFAEEPATQALQAGLRECLGAHKEFIRALGLRAAAVPQTVTSLPEGSWSREAIEVYKRTLQAELKKAQGQIGKARAQASQAQERAAQARARVGRLAQQEEAAQQRLYRPYSSNPFDANRPTEQSYSVYSRLIDQRQEAQHQALEIERQAESARQASDQVTESLTQAAQARAQEARDQVQGRLNTARLKQEQASIQLRYLAWASQVQQERVTRLQSARQHFLAALASLEVR